MHRQIIMALFIIQTDNLSTNHQRIIQYRQGMHRDPQICRHQIIMHQCMHRGPQICRHHRVPKWIVNLLSARVATRVPLFISKRLYRPAWDAIERWCLPRFGKLSPISEDGEPVPRYIKASPSSYQRIMDIEYNVGDKVHYSDKSKIVFGQLRLMRVWCTITTTDTQEIPKGAYVGENTNIITWVYQRSNYIV